MKSSRVRGLIVSLLLGIVISACGGSDSPVSNDNAHAQSLENNSSDASSSSSSPSADSNTNELPPPDPVFVGESFLVGRNDDACPVYYRPFEATINIPIVVNDQRNTIARNPNITSFLVPFNRGPALYSTKGLIVRDADGNRLPAQFETLSRWNTVHPDNCRQPVRAVYAFVHATPPPGTSTIWRIQHPTSTEGENTTMSITEQSSPAAWIISTGPARFTIRQERFEGLSKVEVRQENGSFTTISEISEDATAAGFQLDHNGSKSTTTLAPWYLKLERAGPQVATIAARGFYADENGTRDLGYTIRLTFVAGSSTVKIDHTYYHGAVAGFQANEAANLTRIGRAWMSIPLSAPISNVAVRAQTDIQNISDPTSSVQVEQIKRIPRDAVVNATNPHRGSTETEEIRYAITANDQTTVSTGGATHPFLAVETPQGAAIATVARMAVREPQGLRYNSGLNALEIDFTSSLIQVGGGRGIWSSAAVDFAPTAPDLQLRASMLQQWSERPLLGTPHITILNPTGIAGPYAAVVMPPYRNIFARLQTIHENTRGYLERARITGIQIWPDLPRTSCDADFNCPTVLGKLYEGGDNNYWNWAKVGLDEFFRTGDNRFIYDFSLGEAITYAETLAIRPDHDNLEASSVTGLAPCFGNSRGNSGDYREGLNHRRDNCPGDYSYDKHLSLAYLATADRRFVDFFEEAGENAVNRFGFPPVDQTQPFLELTLSRLSTQRLETVVVGAEFARDPIASQRLRDALQLYSDFMLERVLINGHSCDTAGSGSNSALSTGRCISSIGWMMPSAYDTIRRMAFLTNNLDLMRWLVMYPVQAAKQFTVLDANGLPDISKQHDASTNNSLNGWRTTYACNVSSAGVDDTTCKKNTTLENNGYFYNDGMVAFLNAFGLGLAVKPSDPNRLCQWLPTTYTAFVDNMSMSEVNQEIWGKSSGQAFSFANEALAAMTHYCR
ncbi:MAG: hypothetical protein HY540_04685 [Deltaproteobacteria bacterium]|nr:hypothetical protein [Deltaproteobacteria bacterium]